MGSRRARREAKEAALIAQENAIAKIGPDINVKKEISSFMKDKPCASLSIPDCENLKAEYKAALNNGGRGCSRCHKSAIGRRFKKIITDKFADVE
jgi:hypothetical protein